MLKSIMNFCCLLPVMGHVLGQGSTRGRHVVDSHASEGASFSTYWRWWRWSSGHDQVQQGHAILSHSEAMRRCNLGIPNFPSSASYFLVYLEARAPFKAYFMSSKF